MITTPDRLSAAIDALERGESVDTRQLATLQALDLVVAGRRFMEDAVLQQEHADRRIEELLRGNL